MRIRSLKHRIGEIFIWAIAICMSNFFGFYQYLPLGSTLYIDDHMFLYVLVVSCLFFVLSLLSGNKVSAIGKRFWGVMVTFTVLILIEIVRSVFRYQQSLLLTIKESSYYVIPIIAFVTFQTMKNKRLDAHTICNILVKVSIISSVVAIAAFILYTFCGINILKLSDDPIHHFRYGTIRFVIGPIMIYLAFIISATRFIKHKYKSLDLWNIALSIIQFVLINKTRTALAYMLMTILIIYILQHKDCITLKLTCRLVLASGICLGILFFNIILQKVNSIIDSEWTIMIRMKAIVFYMEQFVKVPVFGMGFISSNEALPDWVLLRGANGYYYRCDVGLIGLLNEFGVCGVLWVGSFLYIVIRKLKGHTGIYADVVRNIVIYLVISMTSLSFLDSQRTMYLFIIMAISDTYLSRKQNGKLLYERD